MKATASREKTQGSCCTSRGGQNLALTVLYVPFSLDSGGEVLVHQMAYVALEEGLQGAGGWSAGCTV